MTKGRAERELEELDRVFRALAHASRRHILVVLNARGRRMTAGEIAARFSCSWPTTSRHLRVLEEAGLVTTERQGREWIYVLNSELLHGTLQRWLNWFAPQSEISKTETGKETKKEKGKDDESQ